MKRKVFCFILGAIIFGSISTTLAFSYFADDSEYIPSDNTWPVDNVNDALNYLHTIAGNPFNSIKASNVKTVYDQSHEARTYNVSINTTKGKYLVMLIYSYSGAMQTGSVGTTRSSSVYLTPTNGTCTTIDSQGFTSSGGSVYTGSWYFDQMLDFIFYRCTFTGNGSLVSNSKSTNSNDPDTYIIKYIKFE